MNAKEAKDFLVQQTVEQAALEHVSLSDLEKSMMYFVENDATSCPNPLELNDEFEALYNTTQYEGKIARLLHRAYRRLKADDPEKTRTWDDAMRTLYNGDHYLPVLWDTNRRGENLKGDPGSKVIRCGSIALMVFVVMLALFKIPTIPSLVLAGLGMLLLFLCILTMFFLGQQGYHALRRRKSG
jgi:hypothetical protein